MIAEKTTRCMADTLLPFALCQAHRWLGSCARSIYLYSSRPTTLCWPAWRVPGAVCADRKFGARSARTFSVGARGRLGSAGCPAGEHQGANNRERPYACKGTGSFYNTKVS